MSQCSDLKELKHCIDSAFVLTLNSDTSQDVLRCSENFFAPQKKAVQRNDNADVESMRHFISNYETIDAFTPYNVLKLIYETIREVLKSLAPENKINIRILFYNSRTH